MRPWLALAFVPLPACGAAQVTTAADPPPHAPATDALPAALTTDPPHDADHPAGMIPFALPTGGVAINALLYTAAGAGAHPTVLLLHGFPGNEQNLDLAQAIRRDGWNVLTLHYRGSWGSPGDYSFTHCLEDAQAALAWLRDPRSAAAGHVDPARIVVAGHSLGGFVAGFTAAHDPEVAGAALLSAARIGGASSREDAVKRLESNLLNHAGMHTVGSATSEALADEAMQNAGAWDLRQYAAALATRPLFVVTSDDGLAPADDAIAAAVEGQPGARVTRVHIATDHAYSDRRVELAASVLRWLESLPVAPRAAR